ncbi:MAG: hypothetical protein K6357_05720 [Elusimicrobiota bacterium]
MVLLFLIFLVFSNILNSTEKDLGVGILFGTKSGLSFSYEDERFKKNKTSLNSMVFWDEDDFFISGDWVYNRVYLKERKEDVLNLPYYYGFGAGFLFEKNFKLLLRVPVGINYRFQKEPVEVFLQLVPSLKIIKSMKAEVWLGIGGRYIFKI